MSSKSLPAFLLTALLIFFSSCTKSSREEGALPKEKTFGTKVDYSLGLQDADRTTNLMGNLKAIVVLMDYSDAPVDKVKYPKEKLEAFMFDKTAKGLGHYMAENSGGKYTISGKVFGWYPSKMTAKEINDTPGGLEYSLGRVAEEAVRLVLNEGINPAEFDNDGPDGIPRSEGSKDDDGLVDELYIIPSGKVDCGICMMGQYANFAKRTTFIYLETAEGGFGNIGFYVHEMGHHFYFAWDHYGNHYQGEYGSGCWAQMGLGCWAQNGQVPRNTVWTQPSHFTAFSKETLDWIKPRTINKTTRNIQLTAMEIKPDAVKLPIPGTLEYFEIENRQPIGFEDKLPDGGLLIFRCHSIWKGYFWLLQADGRADLQNGKPVGRPYPPTEANLADDGDPYPGSTNNRRFAPDTNPNSLSLNGLNSGIVVENISDSGNTMTFDVVIDDDVQEGLRNLTTIQGSIKELNSSNVIRRRNAAISLKEIADERAIEPLTLALSDKDAQVREHVVNSLKRIISIASLMIRSNEPKIKEDGERLCSKLKESGAIRELSKLAALGDTEISPPAIDALAPILFCMSDAEKKSAILHLESMPGNEPAQVRAARLKALADLRNPKAEDVFVNALMSDEPEVIAAATDGAAKIKSGKAVTRLVEIANNASTVENTRITALEALRQIGDASVAVNILGLLKEPTLPMRWAVVNALQEMKSKDSLPALIEAMANPDINKGAARYGDIRQGIKGALSGIGREAAPEMIRLLKDEKTPLDAKPFIAGGLGDIGEPSAVMPMVELALSINPESEEWNQRVVVDHEVLNKLINLRTQLAVNAKRIVERKSPEGREADSAQAKIELQKLTDRGVAWLSNSDPKRRIEGIELIKQTTAGAVPTQLYSMLEDKNPDVCRAAANTFAELGDKGAIPALISLLNDEYYGVRNSAAWALGRMKAIEAVQPLIERMGKEKDRRIYASIVSALGEIGTPETTEAMLSALGGWVYEARCSAARYLARHKGDNVVDALIAALPDEDFGKMIKVRWANVSDPRMRVWAIRSLAQLGDKRAMDALKPYLTSDDLSCRWYAAIALANLGGVMTDGVPFELLPLIVGKYIEETTGKELLEFVPREYMRR